VEPNNAESAAPPEAALPAFDFTAEFTVKLVLLATDLYGW